MTIMDKLQAVRDAVAALDPFNQGGRVVHPTHGHFVGNDEASQAVLDAALDDLEQDLRQMTNALPRDDATCQTCFGTGMENTGQICRDCDE